MTDKREITCCLCGNETGDKFILSRLPFDPANCVPRIMCPYCTEVLKALVGAHGTKQQVKLRAFLFRMQREIEGGKQVEE